MDMTKLKFEGHLSGRNNAGLRKMIRDAVSGHRCGPANASAIRTLARTVALTASGKVQLDKAAADYGTVRQAGAHTCDCDTCYAGNLQALGASLPPSRPTTAKREPSCTCGEPAWTGHLLWCEALRGRPEFKARQVNAAERKAGAK